MTNTRVTPSPEMKARLAVGDSATQNAVPNWDIPTLAGAGALRSSANDLLIFLAANLGYVKTPLAADMAAEVSIRRAYRGSQFGDRLRLARSDQGWKFHHLAQRRHRRIPDVYGL